jgi:hypothetical protein
MNSLWKKIGIGSLVVLILVPTIVLVKPQKSEAFIDCLLGQIFGKTKAQLQGLQGKIMSVPVHDGANFTVNTETSVQTKSQTTKECYKDFLVRVLGKTIIRNMTKSIVNWINNGFEGSPSFVTDLDGFLLDVGDQVIGQSIYELGAIGEVLCSPFDLNLRLALGLSYSSTYRDEIVCRLSDIQQNVYDAFVGGNFGGEAGWQQWFDIQASQQNNPYGAFISASRVMDAQIVSATGRETKKLDFGNGFLSMQDCEEYEVRPDGNKGKCMRPGQIRTPGAVIEGTLVEHLGTDIRQLELADEINEIFGALGECCRQQSIQFRRSIECKQQKTWRRTVVFGPDRERKHQC